MSAVQIKTSTLYEQYCTKVHVEKKPDGVVVITALEGEKVVGVYEASTIQAGVVGEAYSRDDILGDICDKLDSFRLN